jgi:hypothetical protein
MSLSEITPSANMSRSVPTTLAAQVHRVERCLLEGQAQNNEHFMRLPGGTRRLIFSKREAQGLRPEQKGALRLCLL